MLGDTACLNLSLNEKEAEVIVNEYFNYIEDIGLSLEFDGIRAYEETDELDLVEIMENICNRLESSMAEYVGV